jgi:hypothetical protein
MSTQGRKRSEGEKGKEKWRILTRIRMMRTVRDIGKIA